MGPKPEKEVSVASLRTRRKNSASSQREGVEISAKGPRVMSRVLVDSAAQKEGIIGGGETCH